MNQVSGLKTKSVCPSDLNSLLHNDSAHFLQQGKHIKQLR